MLGLQVVAEAVGRRLEIIEAFGVGPILDRIAAAAGERYTDVEPGIPGPLLDRCRSGEDDCVGERQIAAQFVDLGEDSAEFFGLVDRPVLLRRKADARSVGAAAMV